jgi:hypothetical protein
MERLVLEARLAELREDATPELLAELAAGEGSNSFYTSSNLAARQAETEEAEAKAENSPPAEEANPEASKGSPQTEEEPEDAENTRKKKRVGMSRSRCVLKLTHDLLAQEAAPQ